MVALLGGSMQSANSPRMGRQRYTDISPRFSAMVTA